VVAQSIYWSFIVENVVSSIIEITKTEGEMALIKEITYKGIVCNYHKIVRVNAEFYGNAPNSNTYTRMDVEVALFKDAAQRDTDCEHSLRVKQYHFLQSAPKSPASEKIDKVYTALKKLPEFDGAVDA
jgi:hypothetical protein